MEHIAFQRDTGTCDPYNVDCSDTDCIRQNLCGKIEQVVNLTERDLCITATVGRSEMVEAIIPRIRANATYVVPGGALWLPRDTYLRATDPDNLADVVHPFGFLGDIRTLSLLPNDAPSGIPL